MSSNISISSSFNISNNITHETPVSAHLVDVVIKVTFAMLVICGLGAAANLTVFLTILRDRNLRNGTGSMVPQLLALSFLICGVIYPATSHYSLALLQYGRNPPKNVCSSLHFLTLTVSIMANWCDAVLAINRFVAVVLPLHYHFMQKKRVKIGLIGICWVVTLIFTFPLAVGWTGSLGLTSLGVCRSISTATNGFSAFLYSFNVYAPFVITAIAALSILCKFSFNLIHAPTKVSGENYSRQTQLVYRLNMSRMLVASFVFSCVCQVPSYLTALVIPALTARYPQILVYTRLLGVFGSAGVPVIFVFMNRDYRRSFLKLMRQAVPSWIDNSAVKPAALYSLNSAFPVLKSGSHSNTGPNYNTDN